MTRVYNKDGEPIDIPDNNEIIPKPKPKAKRNNDPSKPYYGTHADGGIAPHPQDPKFDYRRER